jgi:chromosome segregation protein
MFLKSLEIRGFKSFADKTELKFKKGVTVVVGPNGSGKSNISDSVRWVLGEQSVKNLRGGKMEDVIFAGTQYRKPVGLAQVSLTLDNTDQKLASEYSEVTITRRIFRSGESEYLINNNQCRLKDITSLFMDTGIGKEGYSLIGQGKIDAILSGKPEERRNLLEEAAGIVKFKSRKIEAEKKLENTEQNLIRINDIIATFEERIEPLRIENEKATKFLELSSALKENEISLIVYFLKKIDDNIQKQRSIIDKLTSENIENQKVYDEKLAEVNALESQLENIEDSYKQERNVYYSNKEKISKLNSEIELLTERTNNLLKEIEKNNKEKNELIQLIGSLEELKKSIELELKEKQEKQTSIENTIVDIENKIKNSSKWIVEREKKLSDSKDEEFELLRKITEINNNKTLISNQLKSLSDTLLNVKNNCNNLENLLKINITTKSMLNENMEAFRLEIALLESKFKENKKTLNELITLNNEKDQQVKKISFELNKTEANYNMLTSLEKQYEGYNRSVKALMESIENRKVNINKEHCKILGEVIQVKPGFEIAIEISLGGSISNIITEDEDMAKNLINYLKKNKLGRATFLPLTTIKSKKIVVDNYIKEEKGFLGIASDLIDYDRKYENAINYVLGRTLICEDMDSAIKVAKKSSYNYKVVTLTGEIVNPGGALTGGSIYQKNAGIITRKTEIEKLSDLTKKLLEDKAKLDNEIQDRKKVIKELDDLNLNIKDEIHFKNIEITKLESEISNIDKDSIKLTNNIKIFKNEISISEEKIIKLNEELVSNEEKSQVLQRKQQENKEQIVLLEMEIKKADAGLASERDKITELKINKAQLDEYVLNKINELSRIQREVESNNLKIQESINFILEAQRNVEINKNKKLENQEQIKKIEINIKELDDKAKAYEVNKIRLKENTKVLTASLELLRIEMSKKEDEIHKNQIILTKLEGEKEGYYNRLNEDYSLSFAEASEKAIPIKDFATHKGKTEKLKAEIFKLGTVNVSAIEEYKEVLDKYKFMSSQREDLENARVEILSVIDEMTHKMKEVFKENFIVLNKYFNETFKELFKGGSAELILSEGDELTANIDINVQPPGKKVQNINLMSGGEKVLSAIALLFSILKMKPTPFCILDEIEAALDDANVFRYSEFLKAFSENIQFIVITHRKGTMEAADIMYGVTMEEKGVSKVVSVNLTK